MGYDESAGRVKGARARPARLGLTLSPPRPAGQSVHATQAAPTSEVHSGCPAFASAGENQVQNLGGKMLSMLNFIRIG
jgi:hypothetical protein